MSLKKNNPGCGCCGEESPCSGFCAGENRNEILVVIPASVWQSVAPQSFWCPLAFCEGVGGDYYLTWNASLGSTSLPNITQPCIWALEIPSDVCEQEPPGGPLQAVFYVAVQSLGGTNFRIHFYCLVAGSGYVGVQSYLHWQSDFDTDDGCDGPFSLAYSDESFGLPCEANGTPGNVTVDFNP